MEIFLNALTLSVLLLPFIICILYKTNYLNIVLLHLFPHTLCDKIIAAENKFDTDIMFIVDEFWDDPRSLKKLDKYIIDIDDSESFIERIHDINQKNKNRSLSIILYTTGGLIFSSDMIVEILLSYSTKVNIYIPGFAYSAGSMIALCADKLYMNKFSVMGPVDPQMGYNVDEHGNEDGASSKCFMQLLDEKEDISDDFYLKALESKSLHSDNIENLKKIIHIKKINLSKNRKKRFIDEFASGKHPHHKPFSVNRLQNMGLPVETSIPPEINELFAKFIKYRNLNKI